MFKNTAIIIGVAILGAVILAYFSFSDRYDNPSEKYTATGQINFKEKIISIGNAKLSVAIADESSKQTKGLSEVNKMADDQGMLFIFPQPIIPAFWMKDMLFSLDIIWIDVSGTIIRIEKNVSPDTFPKTFSPSSPVKYVLEVNSGWSDRNNVQTGNNINF